MLDYLKKRKGLFVYFPLAVYWLALFIATSIPTTYIPSVGVGDKFSHFFAYLLLSVLIYLTFSLQNKFDLLNKFPGRLTILIASVYGIFDELHQMLIPGRSAEVLDWVADFLGILVGVFVTKWYLHKFGNNRVS